MIKVDMSAAQLDRQIELLKFYPEILEKHFGPALKEGTQGLKERIRPTIPVLTGRAQRLFRSKVSGKGVNLTGSVGWGSGKNAPWYINIVEYGAKAHEMNTYVPRLKKRIGTHPGFSKRGFMVAGYSAYKPVIDTLMAQANEAVVKELALDK